MTSYLYIVATPIGNLEDMSFRAVRVLKEVTHIAAEDTRRSRILLDHYQIHGKQLHHLDDHSTKHDFEKMISFMKEGQNIALITDAGTPSISDPGSQLVREVLQANLSVVPIPGASAVVTLVSACGQSGPFTFLGFLPRSGKDRKKCLMQIQKTNHSVIFFESPLRLKKTISELSETMPDRFCTIGRELTKTFEEILHGRLEHFANLDREWLGEISVLLGPQSDPPSTDEWTEEFLETSILELLRLNRTIKDIAEEIGFLSGKSKKEVYQFALQIKDNLQRS